MPRLRRSTSALVATCLTLLTAPLAAQTKATVAQFLSPSSPLELARAKDVDRVAWVAYERGMRNVYTAAAPEFKAVRLTSFMQDDGVDVSEVELSDDGSTAIFIRGTNENRQGWVADPSHDPRGAERAVWAVRTSGAGAPWRVAAAEAATLAPDGRSVLYVRDGQIYRARIVPNAAAPASDSTLPFIREWGRQSNPRWSPDGSKIAFVSDRENHAFIGIYDTRTRRVDFVAPSVDCDAAPAWSADSKRIAFIRRPGVPFGSQAQAGTGSIGNPPGPASGRGGRGGGSCLAAAFGRGGGGLGRGEQQREDTTRDRRFPGLYKANFKGGYNLSVMVADVSKCPASSGPTEAGGTECSARELWHNAPNDSSFTTMRAVFWGGDNVLFPLSPPRDEWDRYYAIDTAHPAADPKMLTTTNGLIEDATSAALSRDGKTLYYCTNANDIEKRHIWSVSTSGGEPKQISTDDGIETYPQPLASGKQIAVLYFGAAQPASVGLVATTGGATRVVYPTLPATFPTAAHVTPQVVIVKSPDGLEIHDQLFLPKDLKPGERRPAMIFVHGGPVRQMLPGYHYMQFYHWAYAYNQWLADQGYVVLSVNYRSGVGYGRSFRNAANTMARGNSEYQDVLSAGKYLQTRADVDPSRIGIWGLSYGGLLTSQALARNSDLFVAGADLAGVHLYGNSLDTTNLSYKSSAVSAIDTWKSPVFLVQGDDDRNVDFAQMVGLVQLLRAHNVYYELTVIPDDTHESLIHARWVDIFDKMGDFLHRFVWDHGAPGSQATSSGTKQ
ncbi:MAG TPA: prolyl oligopeptidase family serine peptidase [Gemmatimonadaceae bacterium]|nr:prolyl oligopeptidase family serine peptidase [Gemmatimonadaceae bacterium]